MINGEKIKIYKNYNGDIDGWAKTSKKNERAIMDDSDWYLVESLIQDIKIVKKGLGSSDYSNDVYERLNKNCDSAETVEKLKALAENDEAPRKETFSNKIINIFKRRRRDIP
ncbi:hypothetical protein FW778_22260 [Ginsengibacter hankyongi]|uniref:Uncharacterized protein n=1 Tax=Ginsengibacter hankyongi TaxID=2607284 RepID=A0A5J5IAT6_9BACT|nr:hypothetical protein [Ginsengibacter hankyongi]KAA9034563.1 hypothetical protein FW778_22260 [Ginsengibacter hankyongi]